MPHPIEGQSASANNEPGPSRPGLEGPEPARGALFRGLVNAGADAVAAYTAERGTEAMIVEVAAAQVQPVVREIQRLRTDVDARFEAMGARLEAIDGRLAKVIEDGARQDQRLAAHMAQIRLILGALGLFVTVLIAVFGFLFTR